MTLKPLTKTNTPVLHSHKSRTDQNFRPANLNHQTKAKTTQQQTQHSSHNPIAKKPAWQSKTHPLRLQHDWPHLPITP